MNAKKTMYEIVKKAVEEKRTDYFIVPGRSQRDVRKWYKSGDFKFKLEYDIYGNSRFWVSVFSNRKENHGWESHIPIKKIAKSIIASGFIFEK